MLVSAHKPSNACICKEKHHQTCVWYLNISSCPCFVPQGCPADALAAATTNGYSCCLHVSKVSLLQLEHFTTTYQDNMQPEHSPLEILHV